MVRSRCTTVISRDCPILKRRKNETPCGKPGGLLKPSRVHSGRNLLTVVPDGPGHTQRRALLNHHNSPPPVSSTIDDPSLPHGNARGCDLANRGVISDYTEITLCPANIPPVPVAIPSPSSPSRFTLDSDLDGILPSRGSLRPGSTHKLDPLIALPLQSTPLKPLKSLGSLLDGLREIARKATQVAAESQARRWTHLRPTTSTSKHDRNLTQAVRSSSPIHSVLPRLPTAQALPAAGSALSASSAAQINVAATQDFDKSRHDSHPTFPKDCSARDNSGSSVDAHPDIHRVDVLAILESNQRKAILLPSSPLPGWNTLPCSTIGARDSEDSDYNDSY